MRTADKTIEDLVSKAALALQCASYHEAMLRKAEVTLEEWARRRDEHASQVAAYKADFARAVDEIRRADGNTDV